MKLNKLFTNVDVDTTTGGLALPTTTTTTTLRLLYLTTKCKCPIRKSDHIMPTYLMLQPPKQAQFPKDWQLSKALECPPSLCHLGLHPIRTSKLKRRRENPTRDQGKLGDILCFCTKPR